MREITLARPRYGRFLWSCLSPVLSGTVALSLIGGGGGQTAQAASRSGYNAVTVTLTPASSSVAPNGTLAYTATVSGASSNPYVSWSVDGVWQGNTTVGTIPGVYNTTTYYAPATPGTHVVKATSNYNNTKSASATVTVQAPSAPSGYDAASVALTPSSSTVAAGGTISFTGTVSGASSNPSVSWSVDGVWQGNSTVGTIPGLTTTTTYFAPLNAGTHVVKATSNYNNTKSASATVTVLAPASVSVMVSPGSATLKTGASASITAAVSGSSNTAVAWSVDGIANGNATVGTLTGTGTTVTYTAPAAGGSHAVKATSAADPSKSASTAITVQATATVAVAVSPASASPRCGTGTSLTATVSGSSNTAVSWTVDGVANGNASVGAVTGTGNTVTYMAPATAGSHTVMATSAADPTKNAVAAITAQAAAAVAVSVTPSSASLNTGGSAAITATVSGSSNTAVAWTVDGVANGNTTVGLLTGTGNTVTYTAPAAAGSHAVKATSSADATKSASATVSVLAPAVTIASNPASATVSPSGSLAITATVGGSSNTAVTWAVDGVANGNATVGTLTGTGSTVTYKAPSASGSHTVTATSAANPASSSTTRITVQASTGTATVTLTHPGSSTVNVSGSMLFTATVTGSSNSSVTWAVDGVAGGNATVGKVTSGTGNNTALYQAPAATGSHTVTAISAADATRTASAAVTVASTAYTVINPGNVYNVKTGFGATGNGSTDDTATIQNAINAASSAGGGLVEVPAGTYMINLAYQMGEVGLLMKSNVTLQLDGGSVIKAKSGAPGTSYMIMFSGGSNMNIVGPGTLDGNKASIGLHEGVENIGFWGASNVVLTGFTSQNAPGDGIYINGYPSGAGVGSPVSNVLIYNVTCTTNGRNGMSPDGCDGLIVRDSTFSNQTSANPGNGIDCEPINDQAPNNFNIFNCLFTGNAGGGIQSGPDDSGDNATFTNMTYAFNTVTNCGDYGLEAQDGTGPVYILNNTVSGTYSGTGAFTCYPGYGIMLRGSNGIKNATISGNTVSGSHSDGIYLGSASASTCSYNTVTGSGGKGINNASGSGVTVSNNTLSGNTGGN